GAFMALSLKYGSAVAGDASSKEKLYGLVREFSRRFELRNKTIVCRELLRVDLVGGNASINAARVKEVCPKAVNDAVEILEELNGEVCDE
ncbi:MAG: C-GCAxxG-C-C family protein, partial [Firmicutes bacterium]|nr:C-GCAxxG-C-C family protein [Bacillota bacterium]